MKLKIEDLIPGNIYVQTGVYEFIFTYSRFNKGSVYGFNYIYPPQGSYYYGEDTAYSNGIPGEFREATYKEKRHLQECIKANRFIPFDQIKFEEYYEIY